MNYEYRRARGWPVCRRPIEPYSEVRIEDQRQRTANCILRAAGTAELAAGHCAADTD